MTFNGTLQVEVLWFLQVRCHRARHYTIKKQIRYLTLAQRHEIISVGVLTVDSCVLLALGIWLEIWIFGIEISSRKWDQPTRIRPPVTRGLPTVDTL